MNRRDKIEVFAGMSLLVVGLLLEFLVKQLFWILIYPPPLAKKMLEALPLILWVIGGILLIDYAYRILFSIKARKATTL